MDGSNPKTWDVKKDGVLAAAQNHKIIYEDSFVRVQSVTVPAGTEEPFHLHPWWSVLINVAHPQAQVVNRDAAGRPADTWQFADLMVKPVFVAIAPPTPLHSIKPSGTQTDRVIRVEFKNKVTPKLHRPDWTKETLPVSDNGSDPGTWDAKLDAASAAPGLYKTVFEDELTRVEAIAVPAGKAMPVYTQRYPGVYIDYSNLPSPPQVWVLAPRSPSAEAASSRPRRAIFVGYKQGLP